MCEHFLRNLHSCKPQIYILISTLSLIVQQFPVSSAISGCLSMVQIMQPPWNTFVDLPVVENPDVSLEVQRYVSYVWRQLLLPNSRLTVDVKIAGFELAMVASRKFLQRVSIACYAERCISHSKSVRLSVTRWH